MRFCLGIWLLLSASIAHCHTLVTGGEDGGYYTTGTAIQLLGGDLIESVRSSSGSVENLKLLLDLPDDREGPSLAIVQHDILLRLKTQPASMLAPSLRELHGEVGELSSLLALYPEFVQMVVAEDSSIQSIFQLAQRPVYLGGENSGSRINALDLLTFASLSRSALEGDLQESRFIDIVRVGDLHELMYTGSIESGNEVYGTSTVLEELIEMDVGESISPSMALKLVREGVLAAAFTTQGTLVDQPGLRQVFLRPELIRDFVEQNRYYGIREVRDPRTNDTVTMPFVRAILVALPEAHSRGLSNTDAYTLVRKLYSNRMSLETNVVSTLDANLEFFVGEYMVRGISGQLHAGANRFFKSRNIIPRVSFTELLFVVPLFLIALTLLGHGLRHSLLVAPMLKSFPVRQGFAPGTRLRHWWNIYQNWTAGSWIMILLWVFIITFVVVIYFIRFIEKQHSILWDVENPFAGSSFWDAIFWMVTFAATGFNQDIYPNTLAARILAVIVPLSGLLLTLFVLVTQTFRSEQLAEKRACGLIAPGELKGHLIIFGWNDRIERLIQDLLAYGSPLESRARLLVVAEPRSLRPFERMDVDSSRLAFLRGQGTDQPVLDDARLEYARGAIVLADSAHTKQHNTRSILICTAVRERMARAGRREFPIVAELYFEENRPYFEQAGVTKLCSLGLISSRFISSALLNPGISGLLISMLRFSYSRSARTLSVHQAEEYGLGKGALTGCLFAEALLQLRQIGVLLLAVADKEKLSDTGILEVEFRQDSPYVFGTTENADVYRLKLNDELIVIMPNKVSKTKEQRILGREGLRPFTEQEEVVLLIGNGDIGHEIVEATLPRCRKLIHCMPSNSTTAVDPCRGQPERSSLEIIRAPEVLTQSFFLNNAASFREVTRVVVLGPDRNVHSNMPERLQDDETLRVALMVKRVSGEIFELGERVYCSAEMRSIDNLGLFHDVGIDQPIPTALLLEQMLMHMVFHRGVLSEFLLKSMSMKSINRRGRLVRLSLPRIEELISESVVGLTHDELLALLIEYRIQLVAIQKGNVAGEEYLFIINPQKGEPGAIDYKLCNEDFLFCFVPIEVADSGLDVVKCN